MRGEQEVVKDMLGVVEDKQMAVEGPPESL